MKINKKIIANVAVIIILVIFFNGYYDRVYKMKQKINIENKLVFNLSRAVDKFQDLEDRGTDFSYRAATASFYTLIDSVHDYDRVCKEHLDYQLEMRILYGHLLSKKRVNPEHIVKIKETLVFMQDNYKYPNYMMLFEEFKKINNEMLFDGQDR